MALDKIKNRNELAKYFGEQGFNKGAEIGVLSGSYSAELCKQNPNLKLYCIDMWDLNPSRYIGFRERKYEQAVKVLEPYNCELIKAYSLDAVKDFEDESLDFVYIDANHSFDNVMRDIIEWTRKVKKGGIVSGHDYANSKRCGVKDAVNVYTKQHKRELFVLPEPNRKWIPRDPSDEVAGLSWAFVR